MPILQRRADCHGLGSFAVDMSADSVGQWLLHCHVSEHMDKGMLATVLLPLKKISSDSADFDFAVLF